MIFDWNDDKNQQLKLERNISFETIVVAIEEGKLLDVLEHHNKERYPNQWILIVQIETYAVCVPCLIKDESYFLKTIFPSRKYTQLYLKEKQNDQ